MPPQIPRGAESGQTAEIAAAVKKYLYATLMLFGVAVAIVSIRGFFFHQDYPFNTFLFDPDYRFSDLTMFTPRLQRWAAGGAFYGPAETMKFIYLPAALLEYGMLFAPARWNASGAIGLSIGFVVLGAVAGCVALVRSLIRSQSPRVLWVAAVAGVALSYPILFVVDRGNIEAVSVFLCGAGVLLLVRRHYTWAALLFGLGASAKIVPAILFLLLLRKRRYLDIAIGTGAFALVNVAALFLAGPHFGETLQRFLHEMRSADSFFMMYNREVGFYHSAFSFIKQTIYFVFRLRHPAPATPPVPVFYAIYPWYCLLAAAVFGIVYWFRIWRLPFLNQLMALVVCQLLLPPFSGDYKLLYLYIPWCAFFVFLAREALPGRIRFGGSQTLQMLMPFAVLFTPQSYLVMRSSSCGGQVKTVALVLLLVATLRWPMPAKSLDG